MLDPRKRRYLYFMLAGFGAISLSVLLFFFLQKYIIGGLTAGAVKE